MSPTEEALAEIAAAHRAMASAFQTILDATEILWRQPMAIEARESLDAIVMACAADDLAGQRLVRASRLLRGIGEDPLLRGPALAGQGLNQNAADALFAARDSGG